MFRCQPRPALRRLTVLSALLLFGLAQTVGAQNVICARDTTIHSPVRGTVCVGYATAKDYHDRLRPTSPTVRLMSGSKISKRLIACNRSVIVVNGGSVTGKVLAFDNSAINLHGGKFAGGLYAYNSSTVNLYGTNLKKTVKISGMVFAEYVLSGKLSDGSSLDGTSITVEFGNGAKLNLINAPAAH